MRKMDITNVVPIQMAMPTPPTSHQESPADTQAATPAETHQTPPASHQESPTVIPEAQVSSATTPPTATEPQLSPAQTTEPTPPIQFL
ncbi:hypothetical protein V6N12_068678 [Hibiscus sabdariffa]|uniref:Uncharacterized protein n=1 Tax=Hibiscus sabdariffa TaxID=183260 RepID=A0ABR2FRE9_9ROSI